MTTYTVRPGDTLSRIAQRFDTSVSAIAKRNDIENPNRIDVGQRLSIGGAATSSQTAALKTAAAKKKAQTAKTYTVKSGDTFSGIAAKHDLSLAALKRLNPQVRDINVISVGQKLTVRAGAAPAPQPQPQPPSNVVPKGMPNTSNMTDAQEYALYSKYVMKHGDAKAKQDLAAGKRVVVGLRVDTPFTADRPYRGTYDDRIVVMWKDEKGRPRVEEFSGNTEPNRRWADDPSQRTKPVGRLVANKTYHYVKSYSAPFGGNILRPDLRYGNPTVRRDTNRDHKIDGKDKVFNGDWGGQVYYFHRGSASDTYSAGCQTMEQSRFNSFWAALGSQREFSYVLASVR